jgi:hypothetical protein
MPSIERPAMPVSAMDMRYSNRFASSFCLSCFFSGFLLLVTVSSGWCAPNAPAAVKGPNTPAPAAEPVNAGPYVPPTGEFSVMMPGRIITQPMPTSYGKVPTYLARSGTTNYVVTGVNLGDQPNGFDQYMHGFVELLKKKSNMSVAVSDASGQGWTGKQCNFAKNGNERVTAVVAKANGTNVIYSAMVDAPANSEAAKKFLGSLIIFPDKALAAHRNDPVARTSFADIGGTIGMLIGALVGIGLGIFVMKTREAKKKQGD